MYGRTGTRKDIKKLLGHAVDWKLWRAMITYVMKSQITYKKKIINARTETKRNSKDSNVA